MCIREKLQTVIHNSATYSIFDGKAEGERCISVSAVIAGKETTHTVCLPGSPSDDALLEATVILQEWIKEWLVDELIRRGVNLRDEADMREMLDA